MTYEKQFEEAAEVEGTNPSGPQACAAKGARMLHKNASTRNLMAKLRDDGWVVARNGPGDHVQFKHPIKPGRVTIDTGRREQAIGTLRSIYRQAAWEW